MQNHYKQREGEKANCKQMNFHLRGAHIAHARYPEGIVEAKRLYIIHIFQPPYRSFYLPFLSSCEYVLFPFLCTIEIQWYATAGSDGKQRAFYTYYTSTSAIVTRTSDQRHRRVSFVKEKHIWKWLWKWQGNYVDKGNNVVWPNPNPGPEHTHTEHEHPASKRKNKNKIHFDSSQILRIYFELNAKIEPDTLFCANVWMSSFWDEAVSLFLQIRFDCKWIIWQKWENEIIVCHLI